MGLPGPKSQDLRDALVDAFPDPQRLREMVRLHLDEYVSANQFNWRQESAAVAFELVDWADSAGKVAKLIEAAHAANGGNLHIRAIQERLPSWLEESSAARNPAQPSAARVTQEYGGASPVGHSSEESSPVARVAELEVGFEPLKRGEYVVNLRLIRPDGGSALRHRSTAHLAFDDLRDLTFDVFAYGRRLGQGFFAIPGIREAFAMARGLGPLRVRLIISPSASELAELRWEILADPDAANPRALLFMGERTLFSRAVPSSSWYQRPQYGVCGLRALVVVASGNNISDFAPGVPDPRR